MPEELTDFDWIAWRTKHGWSATHAVVGADAVPPEDCRGYYTVCGQQIPETVLEVVGAGKRGVAASRPLERILGQFGYAVTFGVDATLCRHCKRRVKS